MENKRIIQVDEKVPFKMLVPLSIQHMFAMFGASVLVPFVFGINPAVVLFMNGLGTLLFILITKGRAPAYLGSSFAFLAPAGIVISKWGYSYALGGFVAVGFCGCVLSLIIYKFGSDWIDVVLPPAAMGPVVALIGLELAGTAASNAGLKDEVIDSKNVIVFLVTLLTAVLGSVVFRKFLAVIPILIAIIAGYVAALLCGIVDFSEVAAAPLFSLPNFSTPKFKWEAIVIILPVLLVIASEHIGHQIVTSKIVGRDLLKEPGLHRTLFGDFFSTMLSSQKANSFNSDFPATVKEVVMANLYSRRGLFKRYRKEDYEKLSTVLEKVGMSGYENRLIGNLSGGQQQRIFIARALISEPELLLMDEPTVGVDAKSVRQIMDIISELNKQGMTIIMTNHDTPELVRVSDKLLIFCEHGNGEFVSRNDLTMQQINEIFAGKRVHHHG